MLGVKVGGKSEESEKSEENELSRKWSGVKMWYMTRIHLSNPSKHLNNPLFHKNQQEKFQKLDNGNYNKQILLTTQS
jgi:hypothetical protein